MSEVLCGGLKKSESEFQSGLTAACGPNALAAALRWSDQSATTPGTYAVYQVGRSVSPPVDANGASTLSELEATATAAKLGYAITLPGSGEGVSAFLRRLAGIQPVVLEIAAGHNLVDTLSGAGEDAGPDLQYHYICVWGRNTGGPSGRTSKILPPGYWCSDGDNNTQNPIVNGVRVHRTLNSDLVYYADATLAAALPYGAFAIQAHIRVPMEVFMLVPSGWHDDATAGVLTAPNGVVVKGGMRAFVLNYPGGWRAANVPVSTEQRVAQVELSNLSKGPGVVQYFHYAQLSLPDAPATAHAVYETWVGDEARYLAGIAAQLSAAQTQVAALTAQLAQLQQQSGAAQALAAAVVAVVQANAQNSTQKAA